MSGPRWLLPLAFALVVVAVTSFRPAATPGPFLRDFEAYWSAGSAWNARTDPYGRAILNAERAVPGVDASRDELLPFVAPPPTVALWSLVARLPYVVAANLWCALLVIAAIALAAVVARASAARSTFAFLTACALAIAFDHCDPRIRFPSERSIRVVRGRLGRLVAAQGADALWPFVTQGA